MNIVLNVWIENKEEGSGTSCDMESESYRRNHMFKKNIKELVSRGNKKNAKFKQKMVSMYDVSSVMHPIPEYKTSKHGIIYTNIICKDQKIKRWSSNGKVMRSWCVCGGLLNGLD